MSGWWIVAGLVALWLWSELQESRVRKLYTAARKAQSLARRYHGKGGTR